MAEQADEVDDKDDGWAAPVRGLIRVEMFRRGMNYADLAKALEKIGIKENERALRNKVARGTFSATFFIQAMVAMGVESIPLDARLYPSGKAKPPEVPPGFSLRHWRDEHGQDQYELVPYTPEPDWRRT